MQDIRVLMLITIGLQRDVEKGDVEEIVIEMLQENAAKILLEQERCFLVQEGGALATLINSHAILCGYEYGWFVRADIYKEVLENGEEA